MSCSPPKPYNAVRFQRAQLPTCNFREAGVRLAIQGANLSCYQLDGGYFAPQDCLCSTSPKGRRRCDGLILGCVDETCYVIFFDLKKGKDEEVVSQLEDTLCYFCRCKEGETHHEAWQVERKRWQKHKVVALVMNDKPPKKVTPQWCGKPIHWRSIGRKRSWPSLKALLADIGPL